MYKTNLVLYKPLKLYLKDICAKIIQGDRMNYVTKGQVFNKDKIALCKCIRNDNLESVNILNRCFLLLIIYEGSITVNSNGEIFTSVGPCFVCFNESEDPIILEKNNLKCDAVYFHPKFLNVNMCFGLLRTAGYADIAQNHDMFLLKPFIDAVHTVPISPLMVRKIHTMYDGMHNELYEQRDWYWSCRGRSYFMEIIIALERMYNSYTLPNSQNDSNNKKIQDAIQFIETHYMERITVSSIAKTAGINHTSLTVLFKTVTGQTPMEYVNYHRIKISKKLLAFTEIPIKDIAYRCGFKTVQHFSRVFKSMTETTPALFRRTSVKKRKEEIKF